MVAGWPAFFAFWCAALAPAMALGANRPALWAPMVIAALAAMAALGGRLRVPAAAGALFLAATAWAFSQAAWSPDPGGTIRAATRLAAYGAVFLWAAWLARTPQGGLRLVRIAALWCGALSLYAGAAHVTGWNPIVGALEVYGGAEGPFVNANAFALYAGLGAMAALTALAGALAPDGARPGAAKAMRRLVQGGWMWGAVMVICLSAVALSGSRAGLAATLLGVGVWAAAMRPGAAALMLVISIAAAGAGALWIAGARTPKAIADADRFDVQARLADAILSGSPWGEGFGAFQDAFRAALAESWRWGDWDHAHQMWLETAYELGAPAALLFTAYALIAIEMARAARRRRRGRPIAALGLAAAAASGTQGLVDFSLAIPAVAAMVAALTAAAWAQARS